MASKLGITEVFSIFQLYPYVSLHQKQILNSQTLHTAAVRKTRERKNKERKRVREKNEGNKQGKVKKKKKEKKTKKRVKRGRNGNHHNSGLESSSSGYLQSLL